MSERTRTTIVQDSAGQYRVTVPKSLADALELAGVKVTWSIRGDSLVMTPVDAGNGENADAANTQSTEGDS